MPYTLDALLQDVAGKRGKLAPKESESSPINYGEVWKAYLAYLQACLEAQRGLILSQFCKIGWQVEKKRTGEPKMYPYFQLTEQFCRAFCPDEVAKVKKGPTGIRELCAFEDFNFSKAAIKFSSQLTKDQVFSGLRAIVSQIGEAVGAGKEVEIDFGPIGKLLAREREPRFSFSVSYGGQDAAEAGVDVAAMEAPKPTAAAFRKTVPEAAANLGIDATQPKMPPLDLTEPAMMQDVPPRSQRSEGLYSSASAPNLADSGGRRTPMLTNQQYKREVAYKEAMDRHISEMEARASEAVREKEAWHGHINDCLLQERDEISDKRSRAQQNQYFLRQQVQWREKQKKEQRKDDIVAASAHDFPKFTEPAESEMKEFKAGQGTRMRMDLDEQVRTNNTLRNLQKRRERALEVDQLQANRMEMAMLREAERAKKAYDKEALATAWNSEIRMKNIWKAIESHNKVGSSNSGAQVLDLGSELPPPSRGSTARSAGRLLTGSSRRVPLGASSSMTKLQN